MVRAGVVQPDPAQSELDLQRDPALAALLGGEDRAIEFLTDVKPLCGS
jgi:hypothetical protein